MSDLALVDMQWRADSQELEYSKAQSGVLSQIESLFGPADGPAGILDILAFLSTFAMGAYCVVLLLVNNRLLPKPIRPGPVPAGPH